MLPAVGVKRTREVSELRLTWADVPAEGAWQAVEHAVAVARAGFPELLGVPFMRIEVAKQDPDFERRRPRGA